MKIVEPLDVNLPVAFIVPSRYIPPSSKLHRVWFSGMVPFSLQSTGDISSRRVPSRVPFPSNIPSPVRLWLCIISCEKFPVKSETVATELERTEPSPVNVTSPIPLNSRSLPTTVPFDVVTV